MQKRLKEVLSTIEKVIEPYGWKITACVRTRHYKVTLQNTETRETRKMILPCSASDHRAIKNIKTTAKRIVQRSAA